MDMAPYFLAGNAEEITRIRAGDYKDKDGLWHCGICKKAKQKRIDTAFMHKTVWCICDCRAREIERQKRREQAEEEMRNVQHLRDLFLKPDDPLRKASFSNYRVRKENKKAFQIAKKYTDSFREMIAKGNPKTGEKNIGLVFYGPVGTGKSFTAACIANELIRKNIPVVMTSFVQILQDIQSQDEVEYLKNLNRCRLLVIDDLGAERDTGYALEKVYSVVDSRARTGKPMVLTTNLMFDEMMQNPDRRYRRIYDRIFEHCIPVEIPGRSFRIIKAAQRQKQLTDYF